MPIFRRQDEAPRARTREERERAAAERAARRAAREGSPPPPPPPDLEPEDDATAAAPEPPVVEEPRTEPHDFEPEPHDFAPPEEPLAEEPRDFAPEPRDVAPPEEPVAEEPRDFAPEPRDFAPEEPLDAGPEPRGFEHAAEDPPDAPADAAPEEDFAAAAPSEPLQPTAPFDPLADDTSERGAVEEAAPPIVPPAARRARSGRVAGDDDERPVAPKRVSARERRLPPTPPPPGTPAFSKRRRRRGRILATLALLILVVFALGLNSLFEPFGGEGGEEVTVRIPPGSTVAEVGSVLAENEIVDSGFLFTIRARLAGSEPKAGTYRLKKDSTYGATLDALEENPAAPRTVKVVIPEGRSRTETAPIVREAGLAGSYLDASETARGFKPTRFGAPRGTKTLEGFLFPATYDLAPGAESAKLVQLQLEAFSENIRQVDMKKARRRNLSVYDVLIIASMVEREAMLAKERPIIAAVIHNRLRQGMPLGIDATIRYATRNWSEPLKESELAIDSPFNTRRRTGLPPTPIGSPGLDSIRAAANPADVNFLFYVVKPGGDGAHNFSSTDQQFQRDVDAYNEERERRGGESPASSG